MISPSRMASFQALQTLQKTETLRIPNCSRKEDQRLAERIVYGVLQNERFLESVLAACMSSRPHPQILLILKLSAYQLLFLDRVPPAAVVNDAVSLCKTSGLSFAAGFVNAVLHRVEREKQHFLENGAFPPAIRWSHPDWLVSRLLATYSFDFVEDFMRSNQELPAITLQVNSVNCDFSKLLNLLENANVVILSSDDVNQSIDILSRDVQTLPGYQEGYFFVQDKAARISVQMAQIKKDMQVLDVCAAPGGKSIAAALHGGRVLACDVSGKRLKRCIQNFQRLGLSIPCRVEDACVYNENYSERYAAVIADVPCTGSGVIRKHPEIRRKTESDLIHLLEIQKTILTNVSRYVSPGGILVYSTCSVLPEEDEEQIRQFLEHNSDYRLEPVSIASFSCENGMLRSWPHLNGNDGFFAAALRKHD